MRSWIPTMERMSRRRQFREECELCEMEGPSTSDLSVKSSPMKRHGSRYIYFPETDAKIEKNRFSIRINHPIDISISGKELGIDPSSIVRRWNRGKSNRFSNRFSETFHGHFISYIITHVGYIVRSIGTRFNLGAKKKKKPRIRRNFFFFFFFLICEWNSVESFYTCVNVSSFFFFSFFYIDYSSFLRRNFSLVTRRQNWKTYSANVAMLDLFNNPWNVSSTSDRT